MHAFGREAVTARKLWRLTARIQQAPGFAVGVSLLLVGAAVLYAAFSLQFKTSRADLLSPESDYHRRWLAYVEEFGSDADFVVVADGRNASASSAALDAVATAVEARPDLFGAAFSRLEHWPPSEKALLYLGEADFHRLSEHLKQYDPLLEGNWSLLNLPDIYENLQQQIPRGSGDRRAAQAGSQTDAARFVRWANSVVAFSNGLAASLADPSDYRTAQVTALLAPWTVLLERFTAVQRPVPVPEEKLQVLLVRPVAGSDRFAGQVEAVDALRAIAAEVQQSHPEVSLGLTGLPVLESDEMRSSQRSMSVASILSLIGVSLLFVLGFRDWRYPLLATLTLAIGVGWSFGFLTLAVGHLNILSMAFSIILIGLGIDYSIHYLAHYLQERRRGAVTGEAIEWTVRRVGPGLVTSALTTSVAFFMAWQTEFLGVAELGVIVGGGILLCLLATLVVLPALVTLKDRRAGAVPKRQLFWTARLIAPLHGRPKRVAAVFGALTLVLGVSAFGVRYDYNLLNLQPEGTESVVWQQRLLENSDRSIWAAISMADSAEEVRRRKDALLRQPSIKHVDEIASLFPSQQQRKLAVAAAMDRKLASLPDRAPQSLLVDPRRLIDRVLQLRRTLSHYAEPSRPTAKPAEELMASLQRLTQQLALLSPAAQNERVNSFQQRVIGDLLGRLRTLRAVLPTAPVTRSDLPSGLAERFISPGGKWLLRVHAREDIWEMEPLDRFVRDVRRVDPDATGSPLQTYEASRQMKAGYEQAALYALVVILLLMIAAFRSFWLSLFALVPVGIGLAMLLGTLHLVGITLNPANMIVLPLILGIGVDNGVHVLHDFRMQRRGKYRISPSTASAVLLTSLTTMIGFGTLMIAEHRGVRSLGMVLVIGVGFCLLTSLLLLPAVLGWIVQRPELPSEPTGEECTETAAPNIRHQPADQRIHLSASIEGDGAAGS